MPRKTKIVGLSLPPEINAQVEKHLKKTHKTRSEFFREMIGGYFNTQTPAEPTEYDLAKVLRSYWDLKSSADTKVIPIILSIITNKSGKVLIGERVEEDEWVKNLTWVFPGGELEHIEIEKEVKRITKNTTNLDVEVQQLVAARNHPGSGFKKAQIVALYFHCTITGGNKIKASGSINKLKWVKPLDVFKYFTTSTCDEVTKFLTMIEKST